MDRLRKELERLLDQTRSYYRAKPNDYTKGYIDALEYLEGWLEEEYSEDYDEDY